MYFRRLISGSLKDKSGWGQAGVRKGSLEDVLTWMKKSPEHDHRQKGWKVHGDLLDTGTEGEIVDHLEVSILNDFVNGGPVCQDLRC